VDTQLNPNANEEALGNRDLVTPVSNTRSSTVIRPRRTKASANELRRVRIALAEYARTSGMYDPVDVMVFTKMCIHEASARVESFSACSDALLKEALKVAAASCGVCHRQLDAAAIDPAASAKELTTVPGLSASASFAVRVTHHKSLVSIPESHVRSMPPQSLGELPDLRPARLWNSLMQIMWRPVSTLLTAMFARSE
jgi:hypothetical protein